MLYPPTPEPHTVEIEATNHCSAACSFCPHSVMTRAKGYVEVEPFRQFVTELAKARENLWLNRSANGQIFPRIVFAGLGEPTLHPQLADLVRLSADAGFRTQVVTNGAHLTPRLVTSLIDVGISSLAISLHSLNPTIYAKTMGLRLAATLPRIQGALDLLGPTQVVTQIWRVLPPPGDQRETAADQEAFEQFTRRYPFVAVLGPSEPWSRDGIVPLSIWPVVRDQPSDGPWCQKLYFTYNIAWDGTAVMCCVDYHRITTPLGNVFREGFARIQERREAVFRSAEKPGICGDCRRWRDTEYEDLYLRHIQPNVDDKRAAGPPRPEPASPDARA